MITDALLTSPILNSDNLGVNSAVVQGAPSRQFDEYGGVNLDLDPELAAALKISLEEEKANL